MSEESKSLATNQLIEYVDQINQLESAIYTQEQVYTEVKKNLQLDYIPLPENPKPQIAKVPEKITPRKSRGFLIGGIIMFVFAAFLLYFSVSMETDSELIGTGIFMSLTFFVPGIIFIIQHIKMPKRLKARVEQQYQNAVKEYERIKRENEENEAKYKIAVAEVNAKNDAIREKEVENNKLLGELLVPINQDKETLSKLYGLNYIYPTYRNFVALSTIYQYLASGRCSELSGSNGAYNLYESELRQNLIIGSLDDISKKLDIVQRNQSLIFSAVNNVNNTIIALGGKIIDQNKLIIYNLEQTKKAAKRTAFAATWF